MYTISLKFFIVKMSYDSKILKYLIKFEVL